MPSRRSLPFFLFFLRNTNGSKLEKLLAASGLKWLISSDLCDANCLAVKRLQMQSGILTRNDVHFDERPFKEEKHCDNLRLPSSLQSASFPHRAPVVCGALWGACPASEVTVTIFTWLIIHAFFFSMRLMTFVLATPSRPLRCLMSLDLCLLCSVCALFSCVAPNKGWKPTACTLTRTATHGYFCCQLICLLFFFYLWIYYDCLTAFLFVYFSLLSSIFFVCVCVTYMR